MSHFFCPPPTSKFIWLMNIFFRIVHFRCRILSMGSVSPLCSRRARRSTCHGCMCVISAESGHTGYFFKDVNPKKNIVPFSSRRFDKGPQCGGGFRVFKSQKNRKYAKGMVRQFSSCLEDFIFPPFFFHSLQFCNQRNAPIFAKNPTHSGPRRILILPGIFQGP